MGPVNREPFAQNLFSSLWCTYLIGSIKSRFCDLSLQEDMEKWNELETSSKIRQQRHADLYLLYVEKNYRAKWVNIRLDNCYRKFHCKYLWKKITSLSFFICTKICAKKKNTWQTFLDIWYEKSLTRLHYFCQPYCASVCSLLIITVYWFLLIMHTYLVLLLMRELL